MFRKEPSLEVLLRPYTYPNKLICIKFPSIKDSKVYEVRKENHDKELKETTLVDSVCLCSYSD